MPKTQLEDVLRGVGDGGLGDAEAPQGAPHHGEALVVDALEARRDLDPGRVRGPRADDGGHGFHERRNPSE